MGRRKRKLTAAEKAAKKRRREEFMFIFVNGNQKRVRRPPTIDGLPEEEFIRRNADLIWMHQNEMWEYLEPPLTEAKQPTLKPQTEESLFEESEGERRRDDTNEGGPDLPF